jgi:hypothetical protein
MNARIAADLYLATVSRRTSLHYAGALAFTVTGLLLDPRPVWAQTGEIRLFAFDIHNGHVAKDKRTIKVTEGERIEFRWTADKTVELHLHGYDIKIEVTPDKSASMTFDANITGRFPVGVHGGGGHGNIVYLEVHPR